MRIFTSILLLLALGAYFFPVENLKKNALEKDLPLVIFENPTMYTLNEKNVNRVVVATHAVKYQDRDEMFNADIILKNNDLNFSNRSHHRKTVRSQFFRYGLQKRQFLLSFFFYPLW